MTPAELARLEALAGVPAPFACNEVRAAVPALVAEVRRLAAERDTAVAAERERCARVCEASGETWGADVQREVAWGEAADACADEIRRGPA